MFYGDCLKMCEDFDPNFGGKGTGCSITAHSLTLLFFTSEFFNKNDMTLVSHLPYFSVSPIESKTEMPPF
jgi:hypothetical protein